MCVCKDKTASIKVKAVYIRKTVYVRGNDETTHNKQATEEMLLPSRIFYYLLNIILMSKIFSYVTVFFRS